MAWKKEHLADVFIETSTSEESFISINILFFYLFKPDHLINSQPGVWINEMKKDTQFFLTFSANLSDVIPKYQLLLSRGGHAPVNYKKKEQLMK